MMVEGLKTFSLPSTLKFLSSIIGIDHNTHLLSSYHFMTYNIYKSENLFTQVIQHPLILKSNVKLIQIYDVKYYTFDLK